MVCVASSSPILVTLACFPCPSCMHRWREDPMVRHDSRHRWSSRVSSLVSHVAFLLLLVSCLIHTTTISSSIGSDDLFFAGFNRRGSGRRVRTTWTRSHGCNPSSTAARGTRTATKQIRTLPSHPWPRKACLGSMRFRRHQSGGSGVETDEENLHGEIACVRFACES